MRENDNLCKENELAETAEIVIKDYLRRFTEYSYVDGDCNSKEQIEASITIARQKITGEKIVAFGSLYFIGEVMEWELTNKRVVKSDTPCL